MSKDEIVLALRCCASLECEYECRTTCAFYNTSDELSDCCTKKNTAAADLPCGIPYCGGMRRSRR
nr:MAG TPA: hypothetical protein [Caudoviricetes sp.]